MSSTAITSVMSKIISPSAYFYNDSYEKKQWYLDGSTLSSLSIDIYSVWKDYTGVGVKIGVIDSQIDFRHTDLARAYATALDFNFALDSGAITLSDSDLPLFHGTAVAGVISAEANNGFGTVGIASGAQLVGLGIDYSSSAVTAQVLAALRAAVNVDVANNSWAFVTSFEDDFGTHPDYGQALEYAVAHGRGGLGTVMVFAAGNAGTGGTSNYHNFQNSPLAIAVGAIDPDGTPSSFTSLGANVLLSTAGSEIYTTTLKDRFTEYAGTSFAAPAVSGAVALMLQANPHLGYRDVQQILAYSARREGLSDSANFGDGWRTNGADTFNGGGLHFSDAFGYGMLDVHDAVRLAESWTDTRTMANLATVTGAVAVGSQLVAGSTDHLSAQITIGQAIDVEHVQLALDLRWVDTGDLDVYLTSPDGTRVRLVYDLPGTDRAGSLRNFTFDSVASLGEQSAGTWTIDVCNRNPAALAKDGTPMAGLFDDATLTITGNAAATSDTYVYTDELGTLYSAAERAARSILRDTDGGIDSINAAAVTSNSVIDLSGASPTVIAGVALSVAANTIENAFGGDGNDTLTGSAACNLLRGGRGDDVLVLSGGNDTLDGGAGNDRLMVNTSLASVSGHVRTDGAVEISLRPGETTLVSGVESFAFTDATCSLAQLASRLSGEPASGGTPTPPPATLPGGFDETTRSYAATVNGTDGAEKIKGGDGAELIDGRGGADNLLGNGGNDALYGRDGDDRLSGGIGQDFLDGGNGNDTLNGDAGEDRLLGRGGDDLVKGGDGSDWIAGGAGQDRLYGEAGADVFVFDASDLGAVDTIYDFNAAEGDRLLITGADADATFEIVTRGLSIFLDMHLNGQTIDLARIKGTDIDHLDIRLHPSAIELGTLFM